MFHPTSPTTGYYELSLKEGSVVIGPSMFIRKPGEILHVGWGMSSIDFLVERIAQDRRLGSIQFSSRELNEFAEIYEKYGHTIAEINLRRKMERARNNRERYKLQVLLDILNLIEESRIPRQMGAYIIRNCSM